MALKYEVSFYSDFTSCLLLPCTYLYFSIHTSFLKDVWSRIEMAMGRIVVSITSLPYPMSWWLLISNKLLAGPSKYYSSLVISNLGILAYVFTFLLLSQFHHPNLVFINPFMTGFHFASIEYYPFLYDCSYYPCNAQRLKPWWICQKCTSWNVVKNTVRQGRIIRYN